MPARHPDAEIDRLYQLPLDEFTAARNVLAKTSGAGAAGIRALAKPPLPAWAINQLYWRHRDLYDSLIDAADKLRRAHAAVLAGRGGDVRAAGKAHEDRLEAALRQTLSILGEAGHPATDATRQSLITTLRALPADEPAGRLTRTLQPGGFEMLAGLSIGGKPAGSKSVAARLAQATTPAAATSSRSGAAEPKKPPARPVDPKALARAREAVTAAARALRQAEHTAQREEFERARAVREAERTAKTVQAAREAAADAERALQEAEESAAAAGRVRDAAERRAKEAEAAVERARARADAADAELRNLR